VREITWDEVSNHNKQEDIWVVIDGKVYNLTSYIAMHPGGPEVMAVRAGKDAT